jgi:hypothetical protein
VDEDAPPGTEPPLRFWVSWYEPVHAWHQTDGPENSPEYLTPSWPETIKVLGEWASGRRMSDDAQTVCALIEAPSRADVKAALEAEQREIRFVSWRDANWEPEPSRFPPC